MTSFFSRLLTLPDPDPDDHPFTPDEVTALRAAVPPDADDVLDDATWRDLLLHRYTAAMLAPGTSIFGRQVLERDLRGGVSDDAVAARRARVQALVDDPAQLDALRRTLACLRHADIDVATLLFADTQPVRPGWVGRLLWLPVLLVASIAAALLVSPWGWVGVGVAMYFLVMVHMRYQDRIGRWSRTLRALQMLLRACSLLDGSGLALARAFAGRAAPAGRLSRLLDRSLLAASGVPGAREYADWFAAADVRHYYRTLDVVFGQRDFLRACFWLCAELEADVALARHLRGRQVWCWATRSDARTVAVEGGVHPLLDEARGLSVTLDGKGAFLSGQNGVGKSTFLRMLGLNLVVARAFGFAYARSASLPALPVVASMQNEDSLLGGQSLYIAELARARSLLARARGERPVICLVDEIFRGTNHEESVSAATAVIDELARHALVVVSSHNLVLGSLLAHALAPWRIVPGPDGLMMERGVLGRTNGVALLAEHGFDAAVQRKAEKVAGWLASQRQQLGSEPDFWKLSKIGL
ncbi:MutS-related protein [Massilia putida]|uniref:MutS-related protein n=1 Tax=Massilia putida TaxID=1141883 RepID=UPI000950C960|nr:hypothetical protein [Massilia putida]